MTLARVIELAWSRLFVRTADESDPGFNDVISALRQRGVWVVGVSGLAATLALCAAYAVAGKRFGWSYGDPDVDIVLWDIVTVQLVCVVGIAVARTRLAAKWGRLFVAAMVWLLVIAVIADDVKSGDISFTVAYISLAMLTAVGMTPFRPLQALLLGAGITIGYMLYVGPILATNSLQGLNENTARVTYLMISTLVCVGLSALLYNRRYEVYKSTKRATLLRKQVNDAFHSLTDSYHELEQTKDHLVHAEKMASLGRFATGIAHELRNPLNFVNNFAMTNVELLDDLLGTLEKNGRNKVVRGDRDASEIVSELRRNMQLINRHGTRADNIVGNLLVYANAATVGNKERCNVNTLLDDQIDIALRTIAKRTAVHISLVRDYDESLKWVEAVPHELARSFRNLLHNAFYAVADCAENEAGFHAVVRISTRQVDSWVEICISDNGPGIPARNRERIFEPFFTTKPPGIGTGLGLSLTYDIIVEGHGGTVALMDENDEGATFVIRLPRPDIIAEAARSQSSSLAT